MRKTHPDSWSPCPRPRTLQLPQLTPRSEAPFMPHCASQRCHVASAILRSRPTPLSSIPTVNCLCPSTSFQMIYAGACLRRTLDKTVLSCFLPSRAKSPNKTSITKKASTRSLQRRVPVFHSQQTACPRAARGRRSGPASSGLIVFENLTSTRPTISMVILVGRSSPSIS